MIPHMACRVDYQDNRIVNSSGNLKRQTEREKKSCVKASFLSKSPTQREKKTFLNGGQRRNQRVYRRVCKKIMLIIIIDVEDKKL